MSKVDNIKKFLNDNIKTFGDNTDVELVWEEDCSDKNTDEDDFYLDIEDVIEGDGDVVYLYDKTVEITTEYVYESVNGGNEYDIRSQVYTDNLSNIHSVILIID